MRLLLDTHLLLWAAVQPQRLSAAARGLMDDADNELLFSAASIWEIAIKSQLRRADFGASPAVIARATIDSGFDELPIRSQHAALTAQLPEHHRDPFDRLLVAQAIVEPARLLTVDSALGPYSELVVVM